MSFFSCGYNDDILPEFQSNPKGLYFVYENIARVGECLIRIDEYPFLETCIPWGVNCVQYILYHPLQYLRLHLVFLWNTTNF